MASTHDVNMYSFEPLRKIQNYKFLKLKQCLLNLTIAEILIENSVSKDATCISELDNTPMIQMGSLSNYDNFVMLGWKDIKLKFKQMRGQVLFFLKWAN